MSEAWVVNASPLILLARIGRLDLLERMAPTLLIPGAVIQEVREGEAKDRTATTAMEWAARYQVSNIVVPTIIEHWDLGPGESQVIAHGLRGSRWVVLDDLAARRCAMAHHVPVIGSLGVVLRAKERGVIDEARPLVVKLIEVGMFLDHALLEQALGAVGE